MKRPLAPLPAGPLRFALRASRPQRGWAVAACGAVIVAQVLATLQPVVMKLITDAAIAYGNGDPSQARILWIWTLTFPALFLALELMWRVSGYAGMRWLTRVESNATDALFTYLMGHSAEYFGNRFAGALTNKVHNAANGAFEMMRRCLWQFLPVLVAFVGSVVIMLRSSLLLGVILAVWFAVFLWINWLLVKKKEHTSIQEAEASSVMKGVMVDTATNIAAVHQSGLVQHELTHIRGFIEAKRASTVKNWIASELILTWSNVMQTGLVLALFVLSVRLFLEGALTAGDIVMIMSLSLQITSSMIFIGNEFMFFMNDVGQVKEGLGELLLPQDITDLPDAPPLSVRDASLAFENVSFRYARGGDVFSGFSLVIPGGQKVGLVGMSGAGKTTLASLVLRQYEVQGGRILLGGEDIRSASLDSLRRSIAVVPQDISLFHRTIRENIRYGSIGATDAQVEEAARMAHADTFIAAMPQGYDTLVGERGVKLSGGQRQRIAVARAILKNSPVLILDEATSALDSESEGLIQDALRTLIEGKTVLAIAHRLSTLRAMDRIIVLEKGRVSEDGTHDQLVALGGHYAALWRSQVQGFIQD